MSKRMLVHDRRLPGNAPRIAQNIYVVGPKASTAHVVNWVASYARSQRGLDELLIMCHGLEVSRGEDPARQMTSTETVGSAGLELGMEGLTLSNVALTAAWKSKIRRIYLYACSAARGSDSGNPRYDGSRFCGELALHSGAEIFASDQVQRYATNWTRWETLTDTNRAGTIDFGAWEGTVFSYSPATGSPSVVTPGGMHR